MNLQNTSNPKTETKATVANANAVKTTPIFFIGFPSDEAKLHGLPNDMLKNYSLQAIDSQSLQFALQMLVKQQINNIDVKNETAFATEKYLLIKKNNYLVKINIADIFYIESENKYCHIYTKTDRFLVQKSLRGFYKTLPTNFMNIHRKFIINTDHILSIYPADYLLILKNNTRIPVSQRYRKLLLELFTIIK
jgi:DNA-binding LytR/AlgR family response regulator